eukprot:32199-Eustigmatos_ZCMA.PRE.1
MRPRMLLLAASWSRRRVDSLNVVAYATHSVVLMSVQCFRVELNEERQTVVFRLACCWQRADKEDGETRQMCELVCDLRLLAYA